MNKIKEFFLTLVVFGFSQGCGAMMDTSVLSMEHIIRVVDENENPIEGANISITFHHTHMQEQEKGITFHTREGTFDGETPEIITSDGNDHTIINVVSQGYWNSSYSYRWKTEDLVGDEGTNKYSRQFKIILRKKENPRPLFVNKGELNSTKTFEMVRGYDLEVGDVVAPHGKGKVADLIFTVYQEKMGGEGEYESHLEVTFSNPHDGVIKAKKGPGSESRLLLGSTAPEEGYGAMPKIRKGVADRRGRLTYTATPTKEELESIEGYWLRVRTIKDPETDELVGRYAKISGSGIFYTDETYWGYGFTYYLAPDHSRSLEWNGKSLVPNANLQEVKKH